MHAIVNPDQLAVSLETVLAKRAAAFLTLVPWTVFSPVFLLLPVSSRAGQLGQRFHARLNQEDLPWLDLGALLLLPLTLLSSLICCKASAMPHRPKRFTSVLLSGLSF